MSPRSRRSSGRTCARAAAPLLFALGLAAASIAHAVPPEYFVQLALNPHAPDVMVLRYMNGGDGLFATRDGGKNWSMMCASAIDSRIIDGIQVGVAGDGTALFAGALGGSADYAKTLWEDDKQGCSFARIGTLSEVWMSDIQPDPTDAGVLFAVSSGLSTGRRNGLWKRAANGVWSMVGPHERVMINRLRIASDGDGQRMYQSALREIAVADSDPPVVEYGFVIRTSDDRGETWVEHPFEGESKASLLLEAVDPNDPDTIVASLNKVESDGVPADETKDLILVSDDRGKTFREYLTISEVGGVVFDADGRIWIGDAGSATDQRATQGLWSAKSLAEAPAKVSDDVIKCLAFQPATDTLYACQRISLATVDRDNSGALTPVLRAVSAAGLASCGDKDIVAACEAQLCGAYCGLGHFAQSPLCTAYDTETCGPSAAIMDGTATRDAGMSSGAGGSGAGGGGSGGLPATRDASFDGDDADASTDASDVSLSGTGSDCGCNVIGHGTRHGAAAAWLLVLAGFLARRRRRLS